MFLNRLLIGSLWNAGLICIILIIKRILRNRVSLRFHYYSWFALIASLVFPFLPSGIWHEGSLFSPTRQQSISTYAISGNDAMAGQGTQWLQDSTEMMKQNATGVQLEFLLVVLWLVGVLVLIGYYWCGGYRLRQIKQFAGEPSQRVLNLFHVCCQRLHLNGPIQLRQSRFIAAPISFGWRRPIIVIPKGKADSLTEVELEHILLHELSHIRHKDLITNYLFCGVQALYWFHPLVWLAFRQMRQDREAYCDWSVLNILEDEPERIAYGSTLLNFSAGHRTQFHTANGLCQNKKQLKYRLEQIVAFQRDTKWRIYLGRCLAGILAIVCVLQAPLMAACADNSAEYYVPSNALSIHTGNWDDLFAGQEGCAVIYDLNSDQYIVHNEREITRRVPPCSTVKIYSALNALEQGIITPADNTLSWDGTGYDFDFWNSDHNLTSAMHQSVNWYFQELDRTAGIGELSNFYQGIGYGNAQVGNDPSTYWNGSALKISTLEQVELLTKLYSNAFGLQSENIAAVADSLLLASANDYRLYGKTGTGRVDSTNIAGWFIGYVETPDDTYFFAVYLCEDDGADGSAAVDITLNILKRMGIEVESPLL